MNCMSKTLAGICMPLFLVVAAGCDRVELPTWCTHPSFEEMETCVRIAEEWRSRIGQVGAEDWYHVKECSIIDNGRKPAQVRIEVVTSLEASGCPEFNSALRSAIETVMDSPVSIHATQRLRRQKFHAALLSCWMEVESP